MNDKVPDEKTVWEFRNKLVSKGLVIDFPCGFKEVSKMKKCGTQGAIITAMFNYTKK